MFYTGLPRSCGGSAICGFAPSLEVLIAARVLQGVGAVLMQANSVAIIVAAAGAIQPWPRPGAPAAAQAVGLSAGPMLGRLADLQPGLALGLLSATAGRAAGLAPRSAGPAADPAGRQGIRLRLGGAVLLMPAMTALMIALNEGLLGHRLAGLDRVPRFGVLLLAGFIRRELRAASPLLDLSLFRDHAFSAGNLAGPPVLRHSLRGVLPSALRLRANLWRIRPGGRPALGGDSRHARLPRPAQRPDLRPARAALADHGRHARGLRRLGAALRLARRIARPSTGWSTVALAIFGLGLGLFTAPNNSAIMSSASAAETGEAGGVLNLTRSFGMSTGIATACGGLSWQLAAMTGHGADTLHAPRPDLIAAAHAVVVFAGFALLAAAALAGQRTRAGAKPSRHVKFHLSQMPFLDPRCGMTQERDRRPQGAPMSKSKYLSLICLKVPSARIWRSALLKASSSAVSSLRTAIPAPTPRMSGSVKAGPANS